MESAVNPLVGKPITSDQVAEKFPQSSPEQQDVIAPNLSNPSSIIHRHILHTWTNDDGRNEVYHGLSGVSRGVWLPWEKINLLQNRSMLNK